MSILNLNLLSCGCMCVILYVRITRLSAYADVVVMLGDV